MVYVAIILLTVVFLDCQIMRLQDVNLFEKEFSFAKGRGILLLLAGLVLVVLLGQSNGAIVPYLFLFALGYYLLRRESFRNGLRALRIAGPSMDAPEMLVLKSDAYGVIMGWVFSIMAMGAVLNEVEGISPQGSSELFQILVSIVVSSLVVVVLIRNASRKFSSKGFWFNVGFAQGRSSWIKTVLIPCACGLMIAFLTALAVVMRKVQPSTPMSDVLESAGSSGMLLIFLVLAVLFAPLVEEIIFRGYFFHVARKVKGEKFAVFFVGIVFAALHYGQYWGDWLAIIMVTILGLTLTYLRAVSGTTVSSTLMHYVYNLGVTIIPVIMLLVTNPTYFKYTIYESTYDSEAKEKLLVESIAEDPELAEAYNDLAGLYVEEKKNLDQALDLVDKALSCHEGYRPFLDTKAEILLEMGMYDEAIKIRREILAGRLSEKNRLSQEETIKEIEAIRDGLI